MRLSFFLLLCPVALAVPPTLLTMLPKGEYTSTTGRFLEKILEGVHNETSKFSSNGTIVIEELMKRMEELSSLQNGTLSCLSDLSILFATSLCSLHPSNLLCRDNVAAWALRLLDSWPRVPSGILRRGPFFFLGDFDQCQELIVERKDVHYCTMQASATIDVEIPLTAGLCLPSSCSAEVVKTLSEISLQKMSEVSDAFGFSVGIEMKKVRCQGEDHDWTNNKMILMVAATLICCLMAGGTLFDYSIRKRTENGEEERARAGRDADDEESVVSENGKPMFNAPSIALTYRSMPDLKKTLATRTILVDMLCAFSVRISMNHLFRNSAREIPVLNGIKVISAFWVIFGHVCLFSLPYIDTIQALTSQPITSMSSALLLNSSLSVDTFLFISGAVLAFTLRKRLLFRGPREWTLMKSVSRLCMFYLHRVARLWPPLLLSSIFFAFVYNHLGDGPLWDTSGIFGTQCSLPSFLSHLSFVSNFFPSHCLPWLWHISLDFQLYMVSPLFLFVLYKNSKVFVGIAALLVAATLCYRTVIYVIYQLPANVFIGMLKERKMEEGEIAFRLLYASPFSRSPPFLIGLAVGWIVCVRSAKALPLSAILGIKCSALYFLFYSLFAPLSSQRIPSFVHAILHRTFWSLGLAAVVWLTENGHFSAISYVLSSPKLLPISRLSFGIYLAHEPILLWLIWTQRQPASPSSFGHFVILTATVSILSLIASFIFSVCFEFPIANIERRLFKKTEAAFNRNKGNITEVENEKKWRGEEDVDYSEKTRMWLADVSNPYAAVCKEGVKERDPDEVDCEPSEEREETALERSGSEDSVFELDSLTLVEREQLMSSRC